MSLGLDRLWFGLWFWCLLEDWIRGVCGCGCIYVRICSEEILVGMNSRTGRAEELIYMPIFGHDEDDDQRGKNSTGSEL